jgi:hypothetical protein
MMLTLENDVITLGKDFAGCFTDKKKSHGTVKINGKLFSWISSFDVHAAEHYLRIALENEGKVFGSFMSQSLL